MTATRETSMRKAIYNFISTGNPWKINQIIHIDAMEGIAPAKRNLYRINFNPLTKESH